MSYPNVPLGKSDWDRKVAQAVNHLLNQVEFNQLVIDGMPTDGEVLMLTQFPVARKLAPTSMSGWVPAASVATSDAVVTFKVDGATIGTITYPAGEQDAVVSFTSSDIPADTDFEIILPTPQDATLADFTIVLAFSS